MIDFIMSSVRPSITEYYFSRGERIDVEWYEAGLLPDLPYQQVYAIALDQFTGEAIAVTYDTGDPPNLPGGKIEPGESVESALRREIREELNAETVEYIPLGYQHLSSQAGLCANQVRVAARVRFLGPFRGDTGGAVSGHVRCDLANLNSLINYGLIGERLVALTRIADSGWRTERAA